MIDIAAVWEDGHGNAQLFAFEETPRRKRPIGSAVTYPVGVLLHSTRQFIEYLAKNPSDQSGADFEWSNVPVGTMNLGAGFLRSIRQVKDLPFVVCPLASKAAREFAKHGVALEEEEEEEEEGEGEGSSGVLLDDDDELGDVSIDLDGGGSDPLYIPLVSLEEGGVVSVALYNNHERHLGTALEVRKYKRLGHPYTGGPDAGLNTKDLSRDLASLDTVLEGINLLNEIADDPAMRGGVRAEAKVVFAGTFSFSDALRSGAHAARTVACTNLSSIGSASKLAVKETDEFNRLSLVLVRNQTTKESRALALKAAVNAMGQYVKEHQTPLRQQVRSGALVKSLLADCRASASVSSSSSSSSSAPRVAENDEGGDDREVVVDGDGDGDGEEEEEEDEEDEEDEEEDEEDEEEEEEEEENEDEDEEAECGALGEGRGRLGERGGGVGGGTALESALVGLHPSSSEEEFTRALNALGKNPGGALFFTSALETLSEEESSRLFLPDRCVKRGGSGGSYTAKIAIPTPSSSPGGTGRKPPEVPIAVGPLCRASFAVEIHRGFLAEAYVRRGKSSSATTRLAPDRRHLGLSDEQAKRSFKISNTKGGRVNGFAPHVHPDAKAVVNSKAAQIIVWRFFERMESALKAQAVAASSTAPGEVHVRKESFLSAGRLAATEHFNFRWAAAAFIRLRCLVQSHKLGQGLPPRDFGCLNFTLPGAARRVPTKTPKSAGVVGQQQRRREHEGVPPGQEGVLPQGPRRPREARVFYRCDPLPWGRSRGSSSSFRPLPQHVFDPRRTRPWIRNDDCFQFANNAAEHLLESNRTLPFDDFYTAFNLSWTEHLGTIPIDEAETRAVLRILAGAPECTFLFVEEDLASGVTRTHLAKKNKNKKAPLGSLSEGSSLKRIKKDEVVAV